MKDIDIMYRAFKEYRAETKARSLRNERKVNRKLDTNLDRLTVKKYLCEIEEDWIKAIEEGLVFVEKAVAEERQFIRSDGELVPIEKVRKVSRDSVVHLAKHSNLISRVPEDPEDDLVPDEIYMVEKLSDYAVYENRFLYKLLVELQEFISMRLNKIKKLRMTYICDFALDKSFESKMKIFHFKEEFHEELYNNEYPLSDEKNNALIKRIEDCGQIVTMLLNTNLMQEVSLAPMIKAPITKTNVLKMNNNFKNSLALYDYMCSYKGDGYVTEEVVKDFTPLSDVQANEFIELLSITQFLTSKYGNELSDILESNYLEEEEKRRIEEGKKLLEKIRRLKKRVEESGQGIEEYLVALEERNKMLEKCENDLAIAKNEIIELNRVIDGLNQDIIDLKRQISDLENVILEKDKEIAYLNQKYIDDMNALKAKHRQEILELNEAHRVEILELEAKHQEEMEAMRIDYESQISAIKEEYENQISNLIERYENEKQSIINSYETKLENTKSLYEEKLASMEEEYYSQKETLIASYEQKLVDVEERLTKDFEARIGIQIKEVEELKKTKESLTIELDELKNLHQETVVAKNNEIETLNIKLKDTISTCDEKVSNLNEETLKAIQLEKLAYAEMNALRVQHGLLEVSDDFTSKERFEELENEFLAFNDFFKAQWELTKKEIRKQLLWVKQEQRKK